jgi:hypothetical protein
MAAATIPPVWNASETLEELSVLLRDVQEFAFAEVTGLLGRVRQAQRSERACAETVDEEWRTEIRNSVDAVEETVAFAANLLAEVTRELSDDRVNEILTDEFETVDLEWVLRYRPEVPAPDAIDREALGIAVRVFGRLIAEHMEAEAS